MLISSFGKDERDKKDNKTAFLVVEFKAENLKLKVEDCYQGYNYATWSRAKLFAITNGSELQVYKTVEGELPLKLQPVNNIPHCSDIQDENKLKEILKKRKNSLVMNSPDYYTNATISLEITTSYLPKLLLTRLARFCLSKSCMNGILNKKLFFHWNNLKS